MRQLGVGWAFGIMWRYIMGTCMPILSNFLIVEGGLIVLLIFHLFFIMFFPHRIKPKFCSMNHRISLILFLMTDFQKFQNQRHGSCVSIVIFSKEKVCFDWNAPYTLVYCCTDFFMTKTYRPILNKAFSCEYNDVFNFFF